MIRTESDYQEARSRIAAEAARIQKTKDLLIEQGLTPEAIKRVIDSLNSFHIQLQEELEGYEKIKRGDFDTITNLKDLGRTLIGLRIFAGLSQRKMAGLLNIDESQVSRDERNEYRNITIERASRIFEILRAHIRMEIQVEPPSEIEAPQGELSPA